MKFHTLKLCPSTDLKPLNGKLSHDEFGKAMMLLFTLWENGDEQSSLDIDSEHILAIFGKSGDAEDFVSKVSSIDSDILTVSLDLETLSNKVSSYLLAKLLKNEQLEQAKLANLRMAHTRSSQRSKSLFDAINNEDNELAVKYVDPNVEVLGEYNGWLPTKRYETDGQVFRVRNKHLELLRQAFPGVDVDMEILDIYEWLRDNPLQRKPLAMMNSFIQRWLSNSLTSSVNALNEKDKEFNFDDLPVDF
ncbi:hypothetical protein [Vibrio parahaemolyticus]|uniref:hypothetical protein n=1 Tax=Vibrio parahaemolyticus TaxID=670 RepID=UPI003D7E5D0E